ncbi:MerR family transcriptional regulator [Paenibacillus macquariensis]|uniref:DNA-binding transcriptional regulator, MerR family n=1 Tax=Paenibacillus macquariensis TaxID=948756 RepID=A0ABY1K9Q3_9BACL|nr:MerR family transcriptional regulator [Paenibacillus macquariensis]MEC0092428.1 MerR family transcriptional regulator [Paenibacillus macquariensis]OAB35393.1 hypothetical protein PMSM_09030 [Paenibacillus macquariensis subsp. macquariensis]SIR47507.1 DNA-binding transcriptional regulator, MerR family [Paenibacillus macquariensis]
MNWLKIDDVAKETGLTKRSIRYYEEIGLMTTPERSDGGIRLYTEEDVEYLKTIVLAKKVLGFSLQEIQDYLQIRDRMKHHHNNFQSSTDEAQRISELQNMKETVNQQIDLVQGKMEDMNQILHGLLDTAKRIQQSIDK